MSVPHPQGSNSSVRLTVPCGKCLACLGNKRADWTFRLQRELKSARSAHFLTITYNDTFLPYVELPGYHSSGYNPTAETLRKYDLQLFIKRLRAVQEKVIHDLTINGFMSEKGLKWPKIRYYAVGEYGENTYRPHYHMIIFNIHVHTIRQIDKIWSKEKVSMGFVKVGTVTAASIHYTTGYLITKQNFAYKDYVEKPFNLMSRRPGIGKKYLQTHKSFHRKTQDNYVTLAGGIKQRLPRYYRDKIFNDKEKEKQNSETLKNIDKKEKELHSKLRKYGDNPYEVEELQKKQQIDISNRKLKTKSL